MVVDDIISKAKKSNNIEMIRDHQVIRNCTFEKDEEGKTVYSPRLAADLWNSIVTMIDQIPFVLNGKLILLIGGQYVICKTSSELLAVVSLLGVRVELKKLAGCVDMHQLYATGVILSRNIRAVYELPHYPKDPAGIYQLDIEPRETGRLEELVNMFKPASMVDRSKIKALFCTPFWGGDGGTRPSFIIAGEASDSKGGVRVGKTKLAEAVEQLAGGGLSFGAKDSKDSMLRAIFNDFTGSRIVLFDNIKVSVLSSPDIEGLITRRNISGHELRLGNVGKPNMYTYIFTFNNPKMSGDLIDRSVKITLKRPNDDGLWEEKLSKFIVEHRTELIADIGNILTSNASNKPVRSEFRFKAWERDVFMKVDARKNSAKRLVSTDNNCDIDLGMLIMDSIFDEVSAWNDNPLHSDTTVDMTVDTIAVSNKLLWEILRPLGFRSKQKMWAAIRHQFGNLVKERVHVGAYLTTIFDLNSYIKTLSRSVKKGKKRSFFNEKTSKTGVKSAKNDSQIKLFLMYKTSIVNIVYIRHQNNSVTFDVDASFDDGIKQ